MKIIRNVKLSNYTTIKIGGIADILYFPESTTELANLIKEECPRHFIGGGSNLLIANHNFPCVVCLKDFNKKIEALGEGRYRVGGAVRLQKLINTINEQGYGGIEYLFSVPGLVGGAVAMNAGRGRSFNKNISDYIEEIETINKQGELECFFPDECEFQYRNSIFKNGERIISEVVFKFPEMSLEESNRAKNERIEICKKEQDSYYPNFGSVFSFCDNRIVNLCKKLNLKHGGAEFSKKTSNWIINKGYATFEDVNYLIQKVVFMHRVFKKKCVPEVVVWK